MRRERVAVLLAAEAEPEGTTDLQAVRFETGDTDADSPALSDEQIEYALAEEGSVRGAAALCLEQLAHRFAQLADVSTGDLRVSYGGRSKTLAERAGALRAKASGTAAPFAGGISRSDKEARTEDSDRVQGAFGRHQFDHPCT